MLIPLGVALAIKMIPPDVLADCRAEARVRMAQGTPVNRLAAVMIIVIWALLAAIAVVLVLRLIRK